MISITRVTRPEKLRIGFRPSNQHDQKMISENTNNVTVWQFF